MRKQFNENFHYFLNLLVLFLLLSIPGILLLKKLYTLVSIYVVLISIFIIWINRKTLINNIHAFSTERKNIKNLEYYRITDDNKVIDLEKRKETFSLFRDMTMGTSLILTLNVVAIDNLVQCFFGESSGLKLITAIVISLIVIIGYGGIIAGIVYKYATTIYVTIPMISAVIYFLFLDPFVSFLPDFTRHAGYLLTTLILYFILSYVFPAHVLRKLNSKTVLISSFTTISAAFLIPVLQYFIASNVRNEIYLLNLDTVRKATDISDSLKRIIIDNPYLIEGINHFILKESSSLVTSMTSLIVTAMTISYIVGALIINRKIRKNNLTAKFIYRTLIKKKQPSYSDLIGCSFYGGEEFENLFLNNEVTLKIILENEATIEIPDISKKTRLIAWWKRNSIVYSMLQESHQIFKK